jgi:hypothetical protein
MAGAGAATSTADRSQPPTHSQSGMPQAPLGYESFERRSKWCSAVLKPAHQLGAWLILTGSRLGLFLPMSARPVSKA